MTFHIKPWQFPIETHPALKRANKVRRKKIADRLRSYGIDTYHGCKYFIDGEVVPMRVYYSKLRKCRYGA